MKVVFDIETDGLYNEATKIHCIALKIDEQPTKLYTATESKLSDGCIEMALGILQQADVLIAHNGINSIGNPFTV